MSIKKTKDGKWQVRFRDDMQIQRSKTFKLKKDAESFEAKVKVDLEAGTWVNPKLGKTKLEDIWEEFIALKGAKKKNTIMDYESMWRVHLNPTWGKLSIAQINQVKFDIWVINLGISPQRTRKIHLLMTMLLDHALKTGRIKRNPLKDATGVRDKTNLPDVPRTLVGQVLTIEELFRLAKETGYYEDVVLVLGLCGLRWGELVGLRVQDLSLLDGTLTVRRSILSINGKLEESTTKSKRERSIRLPKVLHDRAHNWVLGKESSDPLFHTPQKALLRGTNFKKRVFAPALQRLQLPHMRLHDLRHVAATIGISAGATPNMVKDMLGHSDVQLTMRVYSHIFDTDREKVADNLNRAINDVQKMCIIDVSEERAKEGDGPFPAQKQGFSEPNPNGFDARPTDYESAALTS